MPVKTCVLAPPAAPRKAKSKAALAPSEKAIQAAIIEAAPDGGIRLVLPLPPLVNRLTRRFGKAMVKSQEARDYVALVATLAGGPLIEGPLCVWIDVYRARKVGDLDGYFKAVLDSMQGVVYVNDSQIVMLTARRFDDKAAPRIVVVVAPERDPSELDAILGD